MATLVFGAVGTLVGGPLGGAIGALVGRQLDSRIIGSPSREGPRLQELKASTSSYGQPVPFHAGRMRTPGTIIWSSDLTEASETGGGGKGKPKTTTYSYSISFAVALAAHPIDGIGRIWADGNLLRGAAGDLKSAGNLRIHLGHEDQEPDPLLLAATNGRSPAYRGCAYAVFENLDLTDFGNRVPALTFELFAGSGAHTLHRIMAPLDLVVETDHELTGIEGFTFDGGAAGASLALLDTVFPLWADASCDPPTIRRRDRTPLALTSLGQAIAWEDGDFGRANGQRHDRSEQQATVGSLRYYDVARDYQPSVQHAARRAGEGQSGSLDFPAALTASVARGLVQSIAGRGSAEKAGLFYRTAEISEAVGPGSIVRVPRAEGLWRIESWEWRDGGIELELRRHAALTTGSLATDSGMARIPSDRAAGTSLLRVFELPWNGEGSPDERQIFAAVGATEGRWAGAALYGERDSALTPLGIAAQRRAVSGRLVKDLPPSSAVMFERETELELILDDSELDLVPTTLGGIAAGANRLLVGNEIIQFLAADQVEAGHWLLTGLLRGRGASEVEASKGHAIGTSATLLDERLIRLGAGDAASFADGIAALDNSGDAPARADIENTGRTLVPPFPVHPRTASLADGSLHLAWTRRARGEWGWRDEVETPLVEQAESYEVGIGPLPAPLAIFPTTAGELTVSQSAVANFASGTPVWVRQIGTHAKSPALLLTTL